MCVRVRVSVSVCVCVCVCAYPSKHIHVAVCGLPNSWTDWHQIWHTYADSSGNEQWLKNNYPLETPGVILRGLCGQKLQAWEMWPNG